MVRKSRIIGFDLIRIFSCICVTIVHFNATVSQYNGTFVYPNSLIPNFYFAGRIYLGSLGVSLFFMLSGATLMYTYGSHKSTLEFYKRRFFSIFPAYWIAFAVATVYDFLYYKGMSNANPWKFLFSVIGMDGYLGNQGIISLDFYKLGEWFLGCIILLYFIYPLLHWAVTKRPIISACIIVAAYVLLIRPEFSIGNKFSSLPNFFVVRIPELLLGMYFIKYRLHEHPCILSVSGVTSFLIAWLLRDSISSLTLCTGLAVLIFSFSTLVCKLIHGERIKCILAKISALTYPIFLVHHWLIDRIIIGFDCAHMPRRYVYMLFFIYFFLTLVLSMLLRKYASKLAACLQNAFPQKVKRS